MSRSRLSRRSSGDVLSIGASGSHHPMTVEMQPGELAVTVLHVHLNRAACAARSAADLGDRIFESVWQYDLSARVRARHLVADRFACRFDIVLDEDAASATVDIEFEVDF